MTPTQTALSHLSDAQVSHLASRSWGKNPHGDATILERLEAPSVAVLLLALLCELESREETRENAAS